MKSSRTNRGKRKNRKNPFPLLIATLGNPGDADLVKRFGPEFGSRQVVNAIRQFRKIHGNKAVINPKIKNLNFGHGKAVLVHQGVEENTVYTPTVKGSKLKGPTWVHKAGDTKYAKGRRNGQNYFTADGKSKVTVYPKSIINRDGMMDG